jgi:hypothetical protein
MLFKGIVTAFLKTNLFRFTGFNAAHAKIFNHPAGYFVKPAGV